MRFRQVGVVRQNWSQTSERRAAQHRCKPVSLCMVAAVLFWMCADVSHAQSAETEELEHFQFVKSITLSDLDSVQQEPLLIAQIRSLDVGANGQMLIVDMLGQQAFLFSPGGNLLAVLDPSVCHPGFEVRPVHAKFLADQSIFLSNAGPWGYRFTPGGGCKGSVDPDYTLSAHAGFLHADPEGGLVGLYRFPDKQIIRYMDASGKTLQEITLPASDYPNATSRMAMGGIVTNGTHLFYAGVAEPNILKLTRDGSVVSRIAHRTAWFRDVSQDLPEVDRSNLAASVQASGRLRAASTLTSNLFDLTDHTIMVQYIDADRGRGYQVFTKEGQLIAQELGIRVRFKHGAGGLVYRVVQPDLDDRGELPNPYLEVYQFNSPQ